MVFKINLVKNLNITSKYIAKLTLNQQMRSVLQKLILLNSLDLLTFKNKPSKEFFSFNIFFFHIASSEVECKNISAEIQTRVSKNVSTLVCARRDELCKVIMT